jgi:hypothetical protein
MPSPVGKYLFKKYKGDKAACYLDCRYASVVLMTDQNECMMIYVEISFSHPGIDNLFLV